MKNAVSRTKTKKQQQNAKTGVESTIAAIWRLQNILSIFNSTEGLNIVQTTILDKEEK